MSQEPKRYKAFLAQESIILETAPGVTKNFLLKDLTGLQRDSFLTENAERLRTNSEGKAVGLKSFKDHQAELIVKSLWDVEASRYATLEEVRALPAATQSELYKDIRILAGLDAKAEETAKNG